jgi:hypothetical protein
MRKHVPALALSFLLIALVSGVSPALAEGGNSPRDTAVGAIQIKDPSRGEYEKVRFSAHSGPTGEDPGGHATVIENSFFLHLRRIHTGEVVCLDVQGNSASIAVRLDVPESGFGHPIMTLLVIDNGNTTTGESPDMAFLSVQPSLPGPFCSFGGAHIHGIPRGNAIVHNAMS